MNLEERIESTCRHYSANEFGEVESLTDATWEVAMDTFLREGIAPFLGGRPAHLEQVDLIHLLAMMIHPEPTESNIPETASELEGRPCWERARKLMKNRHSHSFHVNYGHRLKIVKLVVRDLVIPIYDPNLPILNCPLFDGALPHLRASLHAFSRSAMSMDDAHWSRCALVAVAIQSQRGFVLKEEWEYLLNRMVDDRTQYRGCQCCPQQLRKQRFGFFKKQTDGACNSDVSFCPHAARGVHLAEFLIRTCQARHHAKSDFLEEAFSSLTDAIEWQMHCWRQPPKLQPKRSEEPTCLLTSLLFAAKTFFYFLERFEDQNERNGEDDNLSDAIARRDELINCAIQLVHHWDPTIAGEASELLSIAFAYGSKKSIEGYTKLLFSSLKKSIAIDPANEASSPGCKIMTKDDFSLSCIPNVVSAASRLSPGFALSTIKFLLKRLEAIKEGKDGDHNESLWASTADKTGDVEMEDVDNNKDKSIDKTSSDEEAKRRVEYTANQERFLTRLISSIALSNPVAAAEKADPIIGLLEQVNGHSSRCNLLAALLACRQSRFFAESKENPSEAAVRRLMMRVNDRWGLYQLARHALRTGNFGTAHIFYEKILESSLSEKYFLWISALAKVAEAEFILSRTAARGIPSSTTSYRSALSVFQSMDTLDTAADSTFALQISVIMLRLDFLDLLTGLRQLIREMRLTASGPAKRTRSYLHFQNIVKCFDALGRRYWDCYRKYGLFVCQQSRTSLRTLHALCRFLARSVRLVFADMHASFSAKKEDHWPGTGCSGDSTLPVARFMDRLDEKLLQQMSTSIDPVIRAAAMLEVVDGILMCPVPVPIDFLKVISIPVGVLRLSADPEQNGDDFLEGEPGEQIDDLDLIECYPGVAFTFYVDGEIPDSFVAKSKLPFSTLLLRYRAVYEGPLQEQDDEDKQEDEMPVSNSNSDKNIPQPWNDLLVSARLFANGKFMFSVECPPIREEGNYLIDVQFGCRDIRGGEWDIPVREGTRTLRVQVSRS